MTSSKQESENILAEILAEKNIVLSKNEMKDFDMVSGMTNAEIAQVANDYLSELHTERSEYAAFKKNPQSVDPRDY